MVSHSLGMVSHSLDMVTANQWCSNSLTWWWFREGGPPWWNSEKRGKCATPVPHHPIPSRLMDGLESSSSWGKNRLYTVCRSEISCWAFFSVVSQAVRTKVFPMHNLDILTSSFSIEINPTLFYQFKLVFKSRKSIMIFKNFLSTL